MKLVTKGIFKENEISLNSGGVTSNVAPLQDNMTQILQQGIASISSGIIEQLEIKKQNDIVKIKNDYQNKLLERKNTLIENPSLALDTNWNNEVNSIHTEYSTAISSIKNLNDSERQILGADLKTQELQFTGVVKETGWQELGRQNVNEWIDNNYNLQSSMEKTTDIVALTSINNDRNKLRENGKKLVDQGFLNQSQYIQQEEQTNNSFLNSAKNLFENAVEKSSIKTDDMIMQLQGKSGEEQKKLMFGLIDSENTKIKKLVNEDFKEFFKEYPQATEGIISNYDTKVKGKLQQVVAGLSEDYFNKALLDVSNGKGVFTAQKEYLSLTSSLKTKGIINEEVETKLNSGFKTELGRKVANNITLQVKNQKISEAENIRAKTLQLISEGKTDEAKQIVSDFVTGLNREIVDYNFKFKDPKYVVNTLGANAYDEYNFEESGLTGLIGGILDGIGNIEKEIPYAPTKADQEDFENVYDGLDPEGRAEFDNNKNVKANVETVKTYKGSGNVLTLFSELDDSFDSTFNVVSKEAYNVLKNTGKSNVDSALYFVINQGFAYENAKIRQDDGTYNYGNLGKVSVDNKGVLIPVTSVNGDKKLKPSTNSLKISEENANGIADMILKDKGSAKTFLMGAFKDTLDSNTYTLFNSIVNGNIKDKGQISDILINVNSQMISKRYKNNSGGVGIYTPQEHTTVVKALASKLGINSEDIDLKLLLNTKGVYKGEASTLKGILDYSGDSTFNFSNTKKNDLIKYVNDEKLLDEETRDLLELITYQKDVYGNSKDTDKLFDLVEKGVNYYYSNSNNKKSAVDKKVFQQTMKSSINAITNNAKAITLGKSQKVVTASGRTMEVNKALFINAPQDFNKDVFENMIKAKMFVDDYNSNKLEIKKYQGKDTGFASTNSKNLVNNLLKGKGSITTKSSEVNPKTKKTDTKVIFKDEKGATIKEFWFEDLKNSYNKYNKDLGRGININIRYGDISTFGFKDM